MHFISVFFISFAFQPKKKQKILKPGPWFLGRLPFYCGGTLCALRTMLVSVVGVVGIHWLNPTRGANETRQLASYSNSTRSKLDQNSTRVSSTRA